MPEKLQENAYLHPRNVFARFTASQSDRAIGSLAIAPRDAANAIELLKCHLPRNASAKNMGVRSSGAGGGPGIEIRVACFVSKFHRRESGSVASTTCRSHQARGGMAGILPGAAVATTVVRVIF